MTWQQDLVKKVRKVIKHGWGEVIVNITKDGKKMTTKTGLWDVKDIKTKRTE